MLSAKVTGAAYKQCCTDGTGVLEREGALLQDGVFLCQEGVLERGVFVLPDRDTAVDVVAWLKPLAVGANLGHDAQVVAAQHCRPFVNQNTCLLLKRLTGR